MEFLAKGSILGSVVHSRRRPLMVANVSDQIQ